MKGELLYAQNRRHHQQRLAIFFIALCLTLFAIMYAVTDSIRTHTMPVGQIELAVPYSKYLVGEEVKFTIKNHYNSPIYFTNKCPAEPLNVYRLENGSWVRVHDTATNKDCAKEERQIMIPANSNASGSFAPWHNLFKTPGKYRVVAYVEYYNALPFQEFEVINTLIPAVASPIKTNSSAANPTPTTTRRKQSIPKKSSDDGDGAKTSTSPSPTPSPAPPSSPSSHQTYTVHVTSGGNYDVSSLTINAGDSIKFVYSTPIGDEIITQFSPGTLGSVKLDHDVQSKTVTINSKGTWTFRVSGHSGNTVTLKVI